MVNATEVTEQVPAVETPTVEELKAKVQAEGKWDFSISPKRSRNLNFLAPVVEEKAADDAKPVDAVEKPAEEKAETEEKKPEEAPEATEKTEEAAPAEEAEKTEEKAAEAPVEEKVEEQPSKEAVKRPAETDETEEVEAKKTKDE